MSTLDEIARTGQDGLVSAPARLLGADIAHKLAGSLGMFGYLRGTELARELEHLLDSDLPVSQTEVQSLTAQLLQSVPV